MIIFTMSDLFGLFFAGFALGAFATIVGFGLIARYEYRQKKTRPSN